MWRNEAPPTFPAFFSPSCAHWERVSWRRLEEPDRGTVGHILEEYSKWNRGVKKMQSWATEWKKIQSWRAGVGDYTKLEGDKHVTYFRSLVLLLEWQDLVWVLNLSCKRVQVNWCSFYIMLQKANYVLIFWDVMDQKVVQFFFASISFWSWSCARLCKKNSHLHIYRNTLAAVQKGSRNRLNERLDFPRHHRQSGKHLDMPTNSNGLVTDPPLERDRIDRMRSNMKLGNYRMCLSGCNLSHVCPVFQGNPKENFRATKSSMWIRGSPDIPHIRHESHENYRVNSFWPV